MGSSVTGHAWHERPGPLPADPGRCQSRLYYFVLLTSLDGKANRADGMLAGADDFLSKPLDRDDFQLRIIAAERVTTLHHRLHFQKDPFERLNQQLVEEKARAEELTQQLEQRVQDRTRQLKASSDGIRRCDRPIDDDPRGRRP